MNITEWAKREIEIACALERGKLNARQVEQIS